MVALSSKYNSTTSSTKSGLLSSCGARQAAAAGLGREARSRTAARRARMHKPRYHTRHAAVIVVRQRRGARRRRARRPAAAAVWAGRGVPQEACPAAPHLELYELQELVVQQALLHRLRQQLLYRRLHRRRCRRHGEHDAPTTTCCCAPRGLLIRLLWPPRRRRVPCCTRLLMLTQGAKAADWSRPGRPPEWP